MEREELVKKVYGSEAVGHSRRGRPLGRWKDRVKEYMCVREVLVEGPNSRGRPLGRWKDRVKEYM